MTPRLILPGISLSGTIPLSGDDSRHIFGSLRMREGDFVILCDGKGSEARCALTADGCAVVGEAFKSFGELSSSVHLYPSLSKGERFEWMLQKAAELGAVTITPVLSERCVASGISTGKRQRFLKILRSASEQSGRGRIPELLDVLPFDRAVKSAAGLRIFCYEEERTVSLKSVLTGEELSVMTGPEGGYTPQEARLAEENGWTSVSLGNTILRCETAPLMVLSAAVFIGG
jgi:16S rRNA (uracil1498-N3)-methyltransferase